jgi:hypothetical protein
VKPDRARRKRWKILRDEIGQYNRPAAVRERLARLQEQREIAEHHRQQDEKAWAALLSDTT